jgi:hypothetical protein
MRNCLSVFFICFFLEFFGQYSKGDSLRGTINENRIWWDVQRYDLDVNIDLSEHSIRGYNRIVFKKISDQKKFQVDLQEPLQIDSVLFHQKKCSWNHMYHAWIIDLPAEAASLDSITVYYSGKPRAAKFPPWDGGFSWKKDDKGRHWVGVSCQGLGASVWYPC